jgi:hypothetical protein
MSAASFYGSGAVMGFAPQQVDAMTLWQFASCIDGWNDAHGEDVVEAPSDDEYEDIIARLSPSMLQ